MNSLKHPQKDTYFSKSLEKGLRILALFNEQKRGMSQSEISERLGMNMTSTFRYVNTLVKLGYISRDPSTKQLRPGLQSMVLSSNLLRSGDAHQAIKALVDAAHEDLGITIDVALAIDGAMVTVYRREAEETLVYRLPIVSRAWHTTALGKAYLGHLPEKEMLAMVKQIQLTPKTPNTITNPEAFLKELKTVEGTGISRANEEFMPGLIAIGAPLFNRYTGQLKGSVSFDFATIQFSIEEVETKFSEVLKRLAHGLSEAITSI